MSATSVGQIGLDLVVNKNEFNKQMGGIQKLATKVGKTLAAAFAVKQVFNFGKVCTDLASDLQEVQNVVDVTFPNMTAQIDSFAKNAAGAFGLSETMAKQFSGTFGAMAKSFDFAETEAADMATSLAGLAGDVASFYNLTQEEAYTKLKSVFTGETESLKDLGVVMTQTALDAYALEKGFGKTTSAMSEAEKVALRYAFVQDKLSAASGDFSRTSDSWANQLKVLILQFDTLKATIGEGLIAALTPVIKVINTIIGKLITLATYFSQFTKALLGGSKDADNTATAYKSVENSITGATNGLNKMAAATKKAFGTAGFDELNVLDKKEDTETSSGGAAATSISGADIQFPDVSQNVELTGIEQAASNIREKFTELKNFLSENCGWIVATVAGMVAGIGTYLGIVNFGKIAEKATTAFTTIKTAFSGLSAGFSAPALLIAAVVALIVAGIVDLWNTSDTFRENMKSCWELISTAFQAAWTNIWENGLKPLGAALVELGQTLYTFYEESGLKTIFEFVVTGITWVAGILTSVLVATVSVVVTIILNVITTLINAITSIFNAILWLKDNWVVIWGNIKESASEFITNIKNNLINGITKVKVTWTAIVTAIKVVTTSIFNGIWKSIKGVINSILGGVESMANGVIRGVNRIINALNGLSFDIPDWVPEFGGKTFGFNIPELSEISIPKLAEGGYVKANTPQLAMIGDNRHQGEIVSPENKMYEVTYKAMSDFMKLFMNQIAMMQGSGNQQEIKLVVSGELAPLFRLFKVELDKESARIGTNFEVIYT